MKYGPISNITKSNLTGKNYGSEKGPLILWMALLFFNEEILLTLRERIHKNIGI